MINYHHGEIPNQEEFSETAKKKVLQHIKSIKELMPFLINLTPKERMALPKVNNKRKPFVKKALYYGKTNRELFPKGIDIEAMDRDMVVFDRTGTIDRELSRVAEMVSDTHVYRGVRILHTARSIYKASDLARRSNLPGVDTIYNDLAKHYKRGSYKDNRAENDQMKNPGTDEPLNP